ncbi:MBL fold metallo-hydrolase [Aneurinibacillus migulanus]|uniref:Metallo-beta-lactamase superfamily protein n=2 Tax=Aneurinibacillus migulanus TaxID=47500 RepID=A0A1G8N2J7_ANEMI|nr:MBL fold metallo-hydrolase [Aneurinibacillus migulanus]MED0894541.1 MBL fold metallo-hydrolase [Aneurinibacillus migulanus]MED1616237.1 MBL fold metallo-hydrolase [Aneurinibacillus migulanus]GED16119.1 MBL fold metallo-hydrolase [Aneurinibacillus migulanus]SDI74414.1 Metallo-beta-lactamase superfamily protein [Aneurinibacillus migulanus]
MTTNHIVNLGHDIYQIELVDRMEGGRSTGYFIDAEQKTIVEMGASVSVPRVLNALKQLNIDPEEITYVIVTHIHLDHAGGAGLLLEKLPNAKLIVHPRGARHMIDPSKLIAGAKQVYGDEFDRLFGPMTPVPKEKAIIADDEFELSIGNNRTLYFYDSPGHAYHHFAVYDPTSKGIFSGDSTGMSAPWLREKFGVDFYAPTSSPVQFDPEAMIATLRRFAELDVEQVFMTHYGRHSDAKRVIAENIERTEAFSRIAEEAYQENPTWEHTAEKLRQYFHKELSKLGVPENDPILDSFTFDIEMDAKGMFHYMQTRTRSETR